MNKFGNSKIIYGLSIIIAALTGYNVDMVLMIAQPLFGL